MPSNEKANWIGTLTSSCMVIRANAPIRATAAVFVCVLASYTTRKYVFQSILTVLAARSYKRIKIVAHLTAAIDIRIKCIWCSHR